MNHQQDGDQTHTKEQADSRKGSPEQRKKTLKRMGWICLALMLAAGVVAQGAQGEMVLGVIDAGVVLDVLTTSLLVGAIVCFVAAARIQVAK
jgi:hypothetical protein